MFPGKAQFLAGQRAVVLLASPAAACVQVVDPGVGQGGAERGLADLVTRREITGTADKSSLVVFPLPHSDAVVYLRRYWTTIGNPETWQISGTKEMTKLRRRR